MLNAIQYHLSGIKTTVELLLKGKFLLYFLPGALIVGFYFFFYSLNQEVQESSSSVLNEIPVVGETAAAATKGILTFLDFLFFELIKFLVLVCLSPFNCLLSEKLDNHITGSTFSGGILRIIKDIFRTILIVICALTMEYIFMAIWWIFSLILPIDFLTPIVYFLISAFFIGFAFYDLNLERYSFGIFSSWKFAFAHPFSLFISGALFTLLYWIPIAGIVLAPVLITMIATFVFIKQKNTVPQ